MEDKIICPGCQYSDFEITDIVDSSEGDEELECPECELTFLVNWETNLTFYTTAV